MTLYESISAFVELFAVGIALGLGLDLLMLGVSKAIGLFNRL